MQPAFTTTPRAEDMVTEPDPAKHGDMRHGPGQNTCLGILILCVGCGWIGHFCDGSTDHFFNHKCMVQSECISREDL